MSQSHVRLPDRLDAVGESIKDTARSVVRIGLRGWFHQRRLDGIDNKIVVSGTRGKSSLTRWLYEILHSRDHDTLAKITGNHPVSLHSGEEHPIERDYSRVTLYENETEIRKHTPEDAMIVENQAISAYTTRMVNDVFTDPDVIVLSNVREDHLSTLGGDRHKVARGLVRAIPDGTHVVNGERDPALRKYIDQEIDRLETTVSHVTVPPEESHIPGIESIYALNHVLATIGEEPLDDDSLKAYRDEMRVEWTLLPEGLIYNAAEVNDVQSTEMMRESLTQGYDGPIQPFLYLRGDRRGRTVSFLHYLTDLYERDEEIFEEVHVAGPMADVFARKAEFPVRVHDVEEESAAAVLDSLFESGHPVVLMGNTVASFMRELADEIDEREIRPDEIDEEHDSDRIPTEALADSRAKELAEATPIDSSGTDDEVPPLRRQPIVDALWGLYRSESIGTGVLRRRDRGCGRRRAPHPSLRANGRGGSKKPPLERSRDVPFSDPTAIA
ncbi:Mur ligase [Halalkalicoccus ordinarius]|uniref:Mur ligase n=1 Tax=Halalkalicoccus ordinarius TaxID=3116651 RepID=UPI00300F76F0